MNNTITIGITGGIGSGKSFICRILSAMGYPVFYSDQVAKELMSSDNELISGIKTLFGQEAYTVNQELNRPFLAKKIFEDQSLRNKLNELVHPRVRKEFSRIASETQSPFIFNEAAILFETGAHKNFDRMVLVTAPESLRIQRVQKRDNSSEEEIKKRMNAQWSDEKKIPLADFVIHNDEQQMLLPQIHEMIQKFSS